MDPASRRTAGISGIVFVVLAVAVAILTGDANWDSTDSELRNFYDNTQQNLSITAIALLPFAVAAFLWFVAGLRSFLRSGDRATGALSSAAAIGGGVFGATFLIAGTINNAVAVTLSFIDRYQFDPGVARLMLVLCLIGFTTAQAGAAVLVAATSTVGRQSGLLPTWFVWSGYVVAVLSLFSVLLFAWPIALFGLWVIVLSVLMMRQPAAATGELPTPREESTVTREAPKHGIPG